jgi:D-xylose transport system ATP-binding protein
LKKRFGGITALGGVDFELRAGEIHAMCGENGAGKSTLIKTLSGVHPHGSFEGTVEVEGRVQSFGSVRDAENAGISVIYQELALVDEMTVAENIALGREPRRGLLVDWLSMNRRAIELIERLGVALDPEARLGTLGVGQKQLVEILRALRKDSKILILDEPTAALSESEARRLIDILKQLRARGIACLYVSHRLEEVFEIADRITVLRDGRGVFSASRADTHRDEVVAHMVGRQVTDFFPSRTPSFGAPVLEVNELSVTPVHRDGVALEGISLELRAGEVLGLGGLLGAGRTELLLHLFAGFGKRTSGTVRLLGQDYPNPSPSESIARKLAMLTEDRKGTGLVLGQSIGVNLSLSALSRFTRGGFIDREREFRATEDTFQSLRVKATDLDATVGGLSGGNQQKVALGKALLTEPKVIFLDEPTRGIDVGAKIEIYEIMNRLTSQGHAIVLASSELPELIAMSDRILMLGEGRMGGLFTRAEATPSKLLDSAISATEGARKQTRGDRGAGQVS